MRSGILTDRERTLIKDYLDLQELDKYQKANLRNMVSRAKKFSKNQHLDAELIVAMLFKYAYDKGRPKNAEA